MSDIDADKRAPPAVEAVSRGEERKTVETVLGDDPRLARALEKGADLSVLSKAKDAKFIENALGWVVSALERNESFPAAGEYVSYGDIEKPNQPPRYALPPLNIARKLGWDKETGNFEKFLRRNLVAMVRIKTIFAENGGVLVETETIKPSEIERGREAIRNENLEKGETRSFLVVRNPVSGENIVCLDVAATNLYRQERAWISVGSLTVEENATWLGRMQTNENSALGEARKKLESKEIITLCMCCKRVKNEDGEYEEPIETFYFRQTGVRPSHGICKACAIKEYGFDPDAPDS